MRVLRSMTRLLVVFGTMLLVSCIDGREEFWLNADGSGRADVRYTLPAAAARFQGGEEGVRQMIQELLEKSPALSNPSCEVVTLKDRMTIRVQATFQSVMDLKQVAGATEREKMPPSVSHLAGKIELARHGRTVEFARTVSAGRALGGSLFLPASQFKGRKLEYIVHLPVAASATNAKTISDGGRKLAWEFPLAQAIKGPVSTRFAVKIPVPGWVYGSAGLVLAIAVGGGVLGLRKWKIVRSVTRGD